jgi:NADH pyrophosphatase NudC (nudix superfamily)
MANKLKACPKCGGKGWYFTAKGVERSCVKCVAILFPHMNIKKAN